MKGIIHKLISSAAEVMVANVFYEMTKEDKWVCKFSSNLKTERQMLINALYDFAAFEFLKKRNSHRKQKQRILITLDKACIADEHLKIIKLQEPPKRRESELEFRRNSLFLSKKVNMPP